MRINPTRITHLHNFLDSVNKENDLRFFKSSN